MIHSKPNPEAFIRAILSLGIELDNDQTWLAFEDDARGIESAREAARILNIGMHICAVTTRFSEDHLMSQDYKPDFAQPDFNGYTKQFGLAV